MESSKSETYSKQLELFSRSFIGMQSKLLEDLKTSEKEKKEMEIKLKEVEARLEESESEVASLKDEVANNRQEDERRRTALYVELMDRTQEAEKVKDDYKNDLKKWEAEAAENEAVKKQLMKNIQEISNDLETFKKEVKECNQNLNEKDKKIHQLEKVIENLQKENASTKAILEQNKKELVEMEENLSKALECQKELQEKITTLSGSEEDFQKEKNEWEECKQQLSAVIESLEMEKDILLKENSTLSATVNEKAQELLEEKQNTLIHKAKIYMLASDIRQEHKLLEDKYLEAETELEKLMEKERECAIFMPELLSHVKAMSAQANLSSPSEFGMPSTSQTISSKEIPVVQLENDSEPMDVIVVDDETNSTSKDEEKVEKMCGTDEFLCLNKVLADKDVQTDIEANEPSSPAGERKSDVKIRLMTETTEVACRDIQNKLEFKITVPYVSNSCSCCEHCTKCKATWDSKREKGTKRRHLGERAVSRKQNRTCITSTTEAGCTEPISYSLFANDLEEPLSCPESSSCLSEEEDGTSVLSTDDVEAFSMVVSRRVTAKAAKATARKDFTEVITSMRFLDFGSLKSNEWAAFEKALGSSIERLLVLGEVEYILDLTMNYVLCRETKISLRAEERGRIGSSEKCIAQCFLASLTSDNAELSEGYLQRLIDTVRNGHRCSLYGYASACILYAAICKGASNLNNMRMMFYELFINHKEKAPFLCACMLYIYPESKVISDSDDSFQWVKRSIVHLLSKKPDVMPKSMWTECLLIFRDVCNLPDKSDEKPESILHEIMSSIEENAKQKFFSTDVSDDYVFSIVLLCAQYGKHWSHKEVLQKYVIPFRKSWEGKIVVSGFSSTLKVFDRVQANVCAANE